MHLQLLAFAVGFVGGAWTLLRATSRPLLLASTLLALVCVPTFFHQLETNYADVPLAMFTALGIAALATWLRTGEQGLLPAAALFLAAAALTKNEGETFALAALVAALCVSRRAQVKPLAAHRRRDPRRRPAVAHLARGQPREDRRVLALEPLRAPRT